jgi:DNA-binding beta-propeller fold protein YncE
MKRKKIKIFFALLFVTLFFINACTLRDENSVEDQNNFGYHTSSVANILNGTCAASGCHASKSNQNGLSTERYSEFLKGGNMRPYEKGGYYGGEAIIPYNSEKSLMIQLVKGEVISKTKYNHKILTEGQISTLETWIKNGAKDYFGKPAFSQPESYRVYVCNNGSNNVSVIDGTKKVVSYLFNIYGDNPDQDNSPNWIAEYGSYYYVTLGNAGKILKVRKSDNTIAGELSLTKPGMIVINSLGSKAYIARAYDSLSVYNSIFVVNINNMSLQKKITFPDYGLLHGLAIDNNRKFLYVTDATNNRVYIINTQTDLISDSRFTLNNNYIPLFLKTSPEGNYLYATAFNTNELLVFNAGSRFLIAKVPLLSRPMDLAISPNGNKIYIASSEGNAIEVVTKTGEYWDKTKTITHPTISNPFGIDITANGSFLYVTNLNYSGSFIPTYRIKGERKTSTVTIIGTANENVEKVIETEESSLGIVVEK